MLLLTMNLKSSLSNFLESFIPFTTNEIDLIIKKFVLAKVSKRQKLLVEEKVRTEYYFLIQGCFRMYGINDRGFENNIQFAAENYWITDVSSFYTGKSSQLNIEALESSLILKIQQKDLYRLFDEILKSIGYSKSPSSTNKFRSKMGWWWTLVRQQNNGIWVFWSYINRFPIGFPTLKSPPIWESHLSF